MDPRIPGRRPDQGLINKKKKTSCGFCHPEGPHSENKRKWKNRQMLESHQRTKIQKEKKAGGSMREMVVTIVIRFLWTVWKGLGKTRRIGNQKKNRYCNVVEIN